ncbi:hypothetical protein A6V39_03375 [Candidatus Mycoplasma haematobovis]|uniref:Uncharacterized protein n=1 Tax=Candidatus Mycoplasma haematobovis TaxID=432608 RepID=A0A1A9QD82_9MOLU|nr:hypothetical protein [Candidatus Mycoplasma haematobovis]OAL09926.1 hypothetical protein A6V39_03375 [Candidatus Mycoplasma haematobovis]
MASNLVKVLSIGGGGATVSAGGATTYFLLSEKERPISDVLIENGKILLSTTGTPEDTQWATNWQEFKRTYTETKPPSDNWAISGEWASVFKASGVNADFKSKCTENAKTKVKNKDNKLYKEVEKYCSKNKVNA